MIIDVRKQSILLSIGNYKVGLLLSMRMLMSMAQSNDS